MENLKIRVNNEEESKEAQELFFELGYKKYNWSNLEHYPIQINAASKNMTYSDFRNREDLNGIKKVTLSELRALVSLHKKPINMDKVLNEVRSDALGLLEDKEWLNTKTYEYKKAVDMGGHSKWIEIPEGADICANHENGRLYFWKNDGVTHWVGGLNKFSGNNQKYTTLKEFLNEWPNSKVVWSRHTQPEELPFVDDEPSLNNQYAEIEQVRQKYDPEDINLATGYDLDELALEYGYRNRDIQESDLCYRESLKIFIERKPNQTTINAMNEADTLFADAVNHPSHYASSSIECIDAMEAMLTPEQFIGYLRGNAFKYQWRYENKGGITDLEKAQWYLNKLISRIS